MKHIFRKLFLYIALVIVGCPLLPAPQVFAASADISFQYNLGGSARYGVMSGSTLYSLIGSRLYIVDATDIADLVEAGSLAIPGIGRRISVQGTNLYIACSEGGMLVVDVSDPKNPKQLANMIFDSDGHIGKTFDVAANGQYAYVADHTGLHTVDISNPASPVLTTSFTAFANERHLAYDVYLNGNRAYLTCEGDGLYIFDISNPANPLKISQWKDPENDFGQFYQTVRDGNYLYIAGGIKGLVILDVTDETNPQYVSNYVGDNFGGIIGGIKVGDYCYLQDEFFDMHVMDVSDVTAPFEAASFDVEHHHSLGIWDNGDDTVILANSTYGIRIFDVDGTTVTQKGAFKSPGRIFDSAGKGNYAYLAAGENGVDVYDVSDSASPALVTGVDLEGFVYGVAVEGTNLYAAGTLGTFDEESQGGLLEIVDITNPAGPTIVGSAALSGQPYDVVVRDGLAYVATQTTGMAIVDVSDPTDPEVLSSYDTIGICYGAGLWGDFFVGADGLNGFTLLDVRDATYPKKVVDGFSLGSITDAEIWETHLYLAGGSNGITIADLSLPFNPSFGSTIDPASLREQSGQSKSAAAFNSYMVVAETIGNLGSVRLFDLADPNSPTELEGDSYLVGDPVKVTYNAEQGLVYIASQIAGLYIYDMTLTDEPAIDIDGRWFGSDGTVGIVLELDQAHDVVSGTITLAGATTLQGTVSGVVSGDGASGTIACSDGTSDSITINTSSDDGLTVDISGTNAVSGVSLAAFGIRGQQMLDPTLSALDKAAKDTTGEGAAQALLNIAGNALTAAASGVNLSDKLKPTAVAEGALGLANLNGPVAAVYPYLSSSAYWEIQVAQAISQNMADGICSTYQPQLAFRDTLGDNLVTRGTAAKDRGNGGAALYLYGTAADNYEAVADLYKQNKPSCPAFGYSEFDGYYEGSIDFGIVVAKTRVCVTESDTGSVNGDMYIIIESTGEYLYGVFADDSVNTGDTESLVSGTIEVNVGEITAHLVFDNWKFNASSEQWEGTVTVIEQEVTGNVSLTRISDECPEGYDEL